MAFGGSSLPVVQKKNLGMEVLEVQQQNEESESQTKEVEEVEEQVEGKKRETLDLG